MEYNVFHHLDQVPGRDRISCYDDRLILVERCDEIGIRSCYLAEHHPKPLGMAPSPNLFFAAGAEHFIIPAA